MGRPLTPEIRSQILVGIQAGLPYRDLCAQFQVSKNCVSKIALKAGFRRNDKPGILTSGEAAQVLSRYERGERIASIARSFSVSVDLIRETLHRSGVGRMPPGRRQRPFRHDAFDVLTPDAAYWCGFIFTDGTVVYRKSGWGQPEVAIVLQKRDREHLVKFRDFLQSDHAITPVAPATVSPQVAAPNGGQGTGAFRFSVRSRRLADRLIALGRYGPAVAPELAASRDFWRGVIDGDGSLYISCGIPCVSVVGSRWLLQAYVDFLGPVSRRPIRVRPARSIFTVSTSYKTAIKVVDRLYAGAATALDRKAVRAAEIVAMRNLPLPDLRLF